MLCQNGSQTLSYTAGTERILQYQHHTPSAQMAANFLPAQRRNPVQLYDFCRNPIFGQLLCGRAYRVRDGIMELLTLDGECMDMEGLK